MSGRIGQIAQELSLCIQQRAVDRIALLDQELRSPAWRERPSKALISQTTDASRRLQAGQARVALEGVVENLCNTFAAFDVPAGRAIRDRFNELQEVAQLSAGDRLFDLAGPAVDWLRQQDMRASQEQEHQAVLARLSAEVQDEDADRDELVRLLGSAQRDEREVPADLDAARRRADSGDRSGRGSQIPAGHRRDGHRDHRRRLTGWHRDRVAPEVDSRATNRRADSDTDP